MDDPILITVAAGPAPLSITVAEPEAAPLTLTLPGAPALALEIGEPPPAIVVIVSEGGGSAGPSTPGLVSVVLTEAAYNALSPAAQLDATKWYVIPRVL